MSLILNTEQAELAAKSAALYGSEVESEAAAKEALKQLTAVTEAARAAAIESDNVLATAQARETMAQMLASQKEQEAASLTLAVEHNAAVSAHTWSTCS